MVKCLPAKRVFPFLILTLLVIPQTLYAASIKLAWNVNAEDDISGYKIYYGTSPASYDYNIDLGNVTIYEISGLTEETNYYFAITAFDSSGNESNYSREITTKNCFLGTIFTTIPPFISVIFPCFDFVIEENRFSLFQDNSAILNQIGEFHQSGPQFDATCEYDIELLGEIIHYYWTFNGQGYIFSDFIISGDLNTTIESGNENFEATEFFIAFRDARH